MIALNLVDEAHYGTYQTSLTFGHAPLVFSRFLASNKAQQFLQIYRRTAEGIGLNFSEWTHYVWFALSD